LRRNADRRFLFKSPCLHDWHGQQFSAGCYNDIQFLYPQRGISEHIFPYIHGKLTYNSGGDALVGGAFEYPVLTGVFAWFAGLPIHGANHYFVCQRSCSRRSDC